MAQPTIVDSFETHFIDPDNSDFQVFPPVLKYTVSDKSYFNHNAKGEIVEVATYYNNPINSRFIFGGRQQLLQSQNFSGEKEYTETNIDVYPNPSSDIITINVPLEKTVEFELFNVSGKKVMTGKTKGQINISELGNGTYLLRFNTTESTFVSRIIKS